MTEPKKLAVTRKLSRKEQELVNKFTEGFIELEEIIAEDGRALLLREIVKQRYGSYAPGRERMITKPNWDKVFELKACPNCNPYAENTAHLVENQDLMSCNKCYFKTPKKTFEKARESHERESGWNEKQEELSEEIDKQKLKEDHVNRLLELAQQRADAELRIREKTIKNPKSSEKTRE